MADANESNRKRPNEEIHTHPNKIRVAEREYMLNADGTVLYDHKGVSLILGAAFFLLSSV